MNHKRTYKIPCDGVESFSGKKFANFGLSAIYAAVYTFSIGSDVLESTKYVLDERPKRMASRLVQLSDEFDRELMPDDRCTCHMLSFLLLLVRWVIWY